MFLQRNEIFYPLTAVSGYAGGKSSTADYETVSSGSIGHAEAVQVTLTSSCLEQRRTSTTDAFDL